MTCVVLTRGTDKFWQRTGVNRMVMKAFSTKMFCAKKWSKYTVDTIGEQCYCESFVYRLHTVNYFTLEKEKTNDKSNTNFMCYFQKLYVSVVVDYADTCWNSCWLRAHVLK